MNSLATTPVQIVSVPGPSWLEIVTALTSTITSLVSLYVLFRALMISKHAKRADFFMDFNRRFEEISKLRSSSTIPEEYWRRFFSLQFDQYSAFLEGCVSERSFAYWMNSRYQDFLRLEDYRNAWNRWLGATTCPDADFRDFMDRVHSAGYEVAAAEVLRPRNLRHDMG